MTSSDPDAESPPGVQNVRLTAARVMQAVKTRHVRWVLGISLALGVVALGGVYVWYASIQP
jgi:hypothetical protein